MKHMAASNDKMPNTPGTKFALGNLARGLCGLVLPMTLHTQQSPLILTGSTPLALHSQPCLALHPQAQPDPAWACPAA